MRFCIVPIYNHLLLILTYKRYFNHAFIINYSFEKYEKININVITSFNLIHLLVLYDALQIILLSLATLRTFIRIDSLMETPFFHIFIA